MKYLVIIIGIMVLLCFFIAIVAAILAIMNVASFMSDSFHWGEKDGR